MLYTACILVTTALWSSSPAIGVHGLAVAVAVASKTKPSQTKTVAIVGGGIAGLSCAHQLSSAVTIHNESPTIYNVTVFDTGRLRSGGRCSSRNPHDSPNTKSSSVQR
jgi:malic enzyme